MDLPSPSLIVHQVASEAVEPGDVVVVDRDPVTSDPDELRRTVVYETWVRGERVEAG